MPLTVGNLLADPAAQSFIGVAEADAYLAPEQRRAWDLATNTAREAALVQASRWLAGTMEWRADLFTERALATDLAQVGTVAARLAVEALSVDLWAATDTAGQVQSERVGPVAMTYFKAGRADAAGKVWPWLRPMLAGLVTSGSTTWLMRA